MTKILLVPIFLFFLQIQLFSQNNIEALKQKLLQTDIDFSNLSKEQGMYKSFYTYISNDCVLLRTNHQPMKGIAEIKDFFNAAGTDSGFTLTWQPSFADASESGDLGYTWGIFTVNANDENGNPVTRQGTYVTIWKKESDGKWKFVLDTGNSGLEPKK